MLAHGGPGGCVKAAGRRKDANPSYWVVLCFLLKPTSDTRRPKPASGRATSSVEAACITPEDCLGRNRCACAAKSQVGAKTLSSSHPISFAPSQGGKPEREKNKYPRYLNFYMYPIRRGWKLKDGYSKYPNSFPHVSDPIFLLLAKGRTFHL
jgi:hypothetical protein